MKYQAHISNAICHHPAPGCYLPAAEEGGERRKLLVSLVLLSAPSLLFDDYFLHTNQTLKCLSLTHARAQ